MYCESIPDGVFLISINSRMNCTGYSKLPGDYMSCGRICFSGVYIFQDDIIIGIIVLREGMLCRMTCIMGGHVFPECMPSGWHIFQVNVFFWNTCFTGGQVLLEGTSYRKSCLTGIHILQEYMFSRIAFLTG